MNLRYKRFSWTPPFIQIVFSNGIRHLEPFNDSDIGMAFEMFSCKQCYLCGFKGRNNHTGDIVVGDFWGIKANDMAYDNNGVSVVVVENIKGLSLLKLCVNNEFYLERKDFTEALKCNPRYFTPRENNRINISNFIQKLETSSLHVAIRHITKNKIGYFIKKMHIITLLLVLIPRKIRDIVKK